MTYLSLIASFELLLKCVSVQLNWLFYWNTIWVLKCLKKKRGQVWSNLSGHSIVKFVNFKNLINCWWHMSNSMMDFYPLQCRTISSRKRAWIKNLTVAIPHKINHDDTIGQNRISVHIGIPTSCTNYLFGNSDVIMSTLLILQICWDPSSIL